MNNGNSSSTRLGASIWIFSIQFFIAQVVVQWAWTTPYSLTQNFISDLGNTACAPYPLDSAMYVCSPLHAWMNLSFALLGLGLLAGMALVHGSFSPGLTRTAGIILIALAGPGLVLVGLFPENENIPLHRLGAGTQFVAGNIGMAVLGIAMLRSREWTALAVFSIASGVIGLLATVLFVEEVFLGLGIGGMERVAAYPLPIWLIVAGLCLARNIPNRRVAA